MVKVIKHNLVAVDRLRASAEEPIGIAHGVNCRGAMGAGIARTLCYRWSTILLNYKEIHGSSQPNLGDCQAVKVGENITVFNCWTQETYGPLGTGIHADLEAIRVCLKKVTTYCKKRGIGVLYTPKIGCGLGGLNWTEVSKVYEEIQRETPDVEMIVCVL